MSPRQGAWSVGASLLCALACGGIAREDRAGGLGGSPHGAKADAGQPVAPSSANPAITFDGIHEHPGCIEPPCCNGGSTDTNIEIPSKCKYIVRALWICGCYDAADLDAALRACVAGYLAFPAVGSGTPGDCSGMNCTSIENCSSVYDDELRNFHMPPFRSTCDRSPEPNISRDVYGNCTSA